MLSNRFLPESEHALEPRLGLHPPTFDWGKYAVWPLK